MAFTRPLLAIVLGLQFLSACSSAGGLGFPGIGSSSGGYVPDAKSAAAYETTLRYVETFYPLWFTYIQWKISSVNRLIGPAHMGPVYHVVVAPNDDTLYANSAMDVTDQPTIVTIPRTKDLFSVLSTDGFGDVIDTGISAAGTYGLTAPGWSGSLPSGVTNVPLTANFTALIIRADKYSSEGKNMIPEAERFRRALTAETLSEYQAGKRVHAKLYPVLFFGMPTKTMADGLATKDPIAFLTQLQAAVAADSAPPLTRKEEALSRAFNALFNAQSRDGRPFIAATRKAHELILNCYLNDTGKTNWITFDNIGTTWTYLQRSAIAEFIQYANSHATAAYFQTFKDGTGAALDGAKHSYILTFSKAEIPEAKRFWSVTAYIPQSITLHRNPLHKYLVGSYTRGLQKGKAGSVAIYIAAQQPKGVPTANWLPVPKGGFNLMLRVYGPQGKVESNTYIPPAVRVSNNERR